MTGGTYSESATTLDDLHYIEGVALMHLAFLYPQVPVAVELAAASSAHSYRLRRKLDVMVTALHRNIARYEEQLRSAQEAIARLEQENEHGTDGHPAEPAGPRA